MSTREAQDCTRLSATSEPRDPGHPESGRAKVFFSSGLNFLLNHRMLVIPVLTHRLLTN